MSELVNQMEWFFTGTVSGMRLAVFLVFLVGLCVGSFLNVCIWRIPAGEQVIRGRSRCMTCAKTLRWYDNIPIVSYLQLRGNCRYCGSRISPMYPIVELLTGLLWAGLVAHFGFGPVTYVYALLGAALILVSVVDLREMILPDEITLPGLTLAFILCFFIPALHGLESQWGSLWAGALGAFSGAGFLWVIGVIGKLLFKREAMGLGDVKLMAMVGAVIGWPSVLLVNMILAPLFGALVGFGVKLRYNISLIPYGPFLSIGTVVAIFWGKGLLEWYRSLFFFP